MKEISEELEKRDVVICCECGAIFEGAETLKLSCPKCEDTHSLFWVTSNLSWLDCALLKREGK